MPNQNGDSQPWRRCVQHACNSTQSSQLCPRLQVYTLGSKFTARLLMVSRSRTNKHCEMWGALISQRIWKKMRLRKPESVSVLTVVQTRYVHFTACGLWIATLQTKVTPWLADIMWHMARSEVDDSRFNLIKFENKREQVTADLQHTTAFHVTYVNWLSQDWSILNLPRTLSLLFSK
jgi:hypothetical protein